MLPSCTKIDFFFLAVLILILLAAFIWQVNGSLSIAVADEVAYVTSGVNLVRDGNFKNPFGEPETWFPPVYPLAIGVFSGGGRIDPHWVARWLSLLCGMVCVIETYFIARAISNHRWTPLIASSFLVGNPTFQLYAFAALSESMTLMFSLAAWAAWLYFEQQLFKRWLFVGFFLGLATLTRPECILLLPAFTLIDFAHSRTREQLISMTAGVALCAILLFPYALYLRSATGKFTITNKGEVNLAAGRSEHYKTPREYIDPQTLKMGYYPHQVSPQQEAERYLRNVGKLFSSLRSIYRGPTVLFVVLLAIWGAFDLFGAGQYRYLASILVQGAYLIVVPIYDVGGEKNLHAILPALSILIGLGLGRLLPTEFAWKLNAQNAVAGICLALSAVMLLEAVTRTPRWMAPVAGTQKSLFRSAGEKLGTLEKNPAVVYEVGATIGYYAGKRRGRLTQNELETITQFIDRRESNEQLVFLAFAEGERLHPTVLELLKAKGSDRWKFLFDLGEAKQTVSVFQLKRTQN